MRGRPPRRRHEAGALVPACKKKRVPRGAVHAGARGGPRAARGGATPQWWALAARPRCLPGARLSGDPRAGLRGCSGRGAGASHAPSNHQPCGLRRVLTSAAKMTTQPCARSVHDGRKPLQLQTSRVAAPKTKPDCGNTCRLFPAVCVSLSIEPKLVPEDARREHDHPQKRSGRDSGPMSSFQGSRRANTDKRGRINSKWAHTSTAKTRRGATRDQDSRTAVPSTGNQSWPPPPADHQSPCRAKPPCPMPAWQCPGCAAIPRWCPGCPPTPAAGW